MSGGPPWTDAITVERHPGSAEFMVITDIKPLSRVTYMKARRRQRWQWRLWSRLYPLRHPWRTVRRDD